MIFRFLFAVVLSGCGGAPFETLQGAEAIGDAQQTDAGSVSIHEAAAPDVDTGEVGPPGVVERDAMVEAEDSDGASDGSLVTCTPFIDTAKPDPMYCAGTYAIPDSYAEVDLFPGDTACNPAMPTPPECRCRETYDCMCVVAMAGCAQGKLVSCDDSAGMVTLTCR